MEITVNNQQKNISEKTSLGTLVNEMLGDKQKGVAVALNDTVVGKDQWAQTELKQHDNILIIKATQGG